MTTAVIVVGGWELWLVIVLVRPNILKTNDWMTVEKKMR